MFLCILTNVIIYGMDRCCRWHTVHKLICETNPAQHLWRFNDCQKGKKERNRNKNTRWYGHRHAISLRLLLRQFRKRLNINDSYYFSLNPLATNWTGVTIYKIIITPYFSRKNCDTFYFSPCHPERLKIDFSKSFLEG